MLLLIALLACGDKDGTEVHDADGDGYDAPEDCDDGDVAIHPGAVETCNEADDDCDGEVDEDPQDGVIWHEDADDDGYGDPLITMIACSQPEGWVDDTNDCEDDDALVNPGAPELCDELDNDCDDDVDEEPTDASTWYRDVDEDGHGDAADAMAACEQPGGYVALADDCDDADSDVHPEAPELCNDADDDCDVDIDEEPTDGYTWYVDTDGDGYGDDDAPILACDLVEGTIDQGGDCEDGDETVFPGAEEHCGDGQVNDCEGDVNAAALLCGGWGDPVDVDAVHRDALGGADDGYLGATLAGDLDLDGNGLGDVVLGAFRQDAAAGAVHVLLPYGPDGASTSTGLITGLFEGHELGSEVAALGDLDGDLQTELLVAATMAGDRAQGMVYLLPGGDRVPTLDDALATWEGDADDEIAGTEALASLGDVDDDRKADFIVGARYGSLGATYAGQAYVVSGADTGEHSLASAAARLYSSSSYGYAATRVAGPGDIDGDGIPDAVVEAVGADAAWIAFGHFAGDVDLSADADLRILDGSALTLSSMDGADLDGDGTADLVLSTTVESTHAERAGAVFVHRGPLSADVELTDADLSILGETDSGYLGGEIDLLSDLDGDGQADLLVGTGSSLIRAGSISALGGSGQAFAFSAIGERTGTLLQSDADLSFFNASSGASFGQDVASAGDMNGDGRSDLLFAGPEATWGGGLGDGWTVTSDLRY